MISRVCTTVILLCSVVAFNISCRCGEQPQQEISRKYDWEVKSDPSMSKSQNEYDVIVVGSGIGGLTSASLLAKNGYKVLVLEQGDQVGGFCTSYIRQGFNFPVGAHDISGVENGAVGKLLDTLQLKKEDLFVLHRRTYLLGNRTLTFTKKEDLERELSRIFPKEKEAIQHFFAEAQKAYEEMVAKAYRNDVTSSFLIYEAWQKVSYQQKIEEFFKDEELRTVFYSLLGYLGTKSGETKASTALGACLNYFIWGGYYPKEGGKLFADSLKTFIETHRGTVLLHTKVDEILIKNNAVVGVCSGDKKFYSKIVVANVNAKSLFLQLIPQGVLDASFVKSIQNVKMSKSEATLNVGVDCDLSSLSSIVKAYPHDGSKKYAFCINSSADPTAAPKGQSSLSVGKWADYSEVPALETEEYGKYKQTVKNQFLEELERGIPGITKHIVVQDVITPKTYERFSSIPEGAIYTFDQSIGSARPWFKTPITGLYLASASTFPGGGVEAVTVSGMICVRDILKNKSIHSNDIRLPLPDLTSKCSLEQAIKQRCSTRSFSDEPLSLSTISQLLWASYGVTHEKNLHSVPSAGALYPLKIYFVAVNVTDLRSGVYEYNSLTHALEKRVDGHVVDALFLAANSQKSVQNAPGFIIICGVYQKEQARYGDEAKTYVAMETGCAAENVYLQCASFSIGTVFIAGFDPSMIKHILKLSEEELPLCILPLGHRKK